MPLRALEFFCGLGGFAAAVAGRDLQVIDALDQSPTALAVYRRNFPAHPARQINLEHLQLAELTAFEAEFWWLSPPCQPYCARGTFRDLNDPRAASLRHLLGLFALLPPTRRPRQLALENVAGFARSQARELLLRLLAEGGYEVRERLLCPTELGVPMRRPRYYLSAARTPLAAPSPPSPSPHPLADYLDPAPAAEALYLPSATVARFGDGLRLLDPADPAAYATCFTAGYGRSLMHAGAYLRCGERVRRFSPEEIARLLGFPASFAFPPGIPLRKRWHLLGNSLSVTAVREVLRDGFGIEHRSDGARPGRSAFVMP